MNDFDKASDQINSRDTAFKLFTRLLEAFEKNFLNKDEPRAVVGHLRVSSILALGSEITPFIQDLAPGASERDCRLAVSHALGWIADRLKEDCQKDNPEFLDSLEIQREDRGYYVNVYRGYAPFLHRHILDCKDTLIKYFDDCGDEKMYSIEAVFSVVKRHCELEASIVFSQVPIPAPQL